MEIKICKICGKHNYTQSQTCSQCGRKTPANTLVDLDATLVNLDEHPPLAVPLVQKQTRQDLKSKLKERRTTNWIQEYGILDSTAIVFVLVAGAALILGLFSKNLTILQIIMNAIIAGSSIALAIGIPLYVIKWLSRDLDMWEQNYKFFIAVVISFIIGFLFQAIPDSGNPYLTSNQRLLRAIVNGIGMFISVGIPLCIARWIYNR